MFGKLKDKLKSTFSIFSKQVEQEAEPIDEEELEQVVPEASKAELLDLDADEAEDLEENKKAEEEKERVILDAVESIDNEVNAEELIEEKIEGHSDEKIEVAKSLPTADELLAEDLAEYANENGDDIEEEQKLGEADSKLSNADLIDSKVVEKEDVSDYNVAEVEKVAQKQVEKIDSRVVIDNISEKEKVKPAVVVTKTQVEVKEVVPEEKRSFFSKIKQKLTTKTINQEKFEELFWNLEVVLLESNVSVKVIDRIKTDLSEELVDKPLPRDVARKIQEVLAATLRDILSVEQKDLFKEIADFKKEGKVYTIIFFGINGSGKTTTIAKLAHLIKSKGLSVVMAAGDTFRAAAIDQLQDHANKIDVKLIKHDYGSDAAAVAFDAKKYAQKNNVDVVLIDTAGRLHSNTNLMAELEKMVRVAKPDCKIFIGESITGNDCVEQAAKYEETLGIDGVILTKADIDEMGGAPLSVCYVSGKPILYLGMGQEYQDLVAFSADLILEKLGIEE